MAEREAGKPLVARDLRGELLTAYDEYLDGKRVYEDLPPLRGATVTDVRALSDLGHNLAVAGALPSIVQFVGGA